MPIAIEALVAEAMRSNPEIAGARSHWQGTTKVPRQMGTLDDPQIFLQEFTVGSPAGFRLRDQRFLLHGLWRITGPGTRQALLLSHLLVTGSVRYFF